MGTCDVVVSSIDTAKRNPHREIIYKQEYDLIIIDEAHKLKNNKTKNYEFVQNLKKEILSTINGYTYPKSGRRNFQSCFPIKTRTSRK